MRGGDVYDLVVATVRAIIPDDVSSGGHRFTASDKPFDGNSQDRAFQVGLANLAGLGTHGIGSNRRYELVLQLSVAYQQTGASARRACNDSDLIVDAIRDLSNTAGVQLVTVTPTGFATTGGQPGQPMGICATWQIAIEYQRNLV